MRPSSWLKDGIRPCFHPHFNLSRIHGSITQPLSVTLSERKATICWGTRNQ